MDKPYAWPTLTGHALNIFFMILAESYIVEKANKCLDFTITVFLYHLFFTWLFHSFPWSLDWWIAHFIIVTVTILASEFICLKIETAEIKLNVNDFIEKGKKSAKEFIENSGKMKKRFKKVPPPKTKFKCDDD